jgi:hypothetical protein
LRIWLGVALLLALGSLAVARYAASPIWIDALLATGGFLGLAVALAAGLALRRALSAWKAVAAMLLGVGAMLARASLIAELLVAGGGPARQVDFWRMALAVSTVVWGALALIWGALAVGEALELRHAGGTPRGASATNDHARRPPRRRDLEIVVAAIGLTIALYCLAPLWSLLGLRINHWTVLGLFGLAVVANGLGAAYRWAADRLGGASRNDS